MFRKFGIIFTPLVIILSILSSSLFLISCTHDGLYPSAKICVVSDLHVFDPMLGTSGSAFEEYLSGSRKLIAESEEILKSLIQVILSEDVEIVLVTGDLTKDGEHASHTMLAEYLGLLENAGKQVFVIPGNHDINNLNSVGYSGADTNPVPSTSAGEFEEIYYDYGYGEALSRDTASLSYIVEPRKGLWIMAMDSCRYEDIPSTGGGFSESTLQWILSALERARSRNITVFGMMHHGLVNHFNAQSLFFPEYIIDDWKGVSDDFADMDMKIVFTGHFHAQDIVKGASDNGGFLFDVETGSMITYPCPLRIIQLKAGGQLIISSRRISEINYDTGGKSFQEYAKDFLEYGLEDTMVESLIDQFQLSQSDAQQFAPHMASGLIAHYEGDESLSPQTRNIIEQLEEDLDLRKQMLGFGLNSIWTDLPPRDNDIIINLITGKIR
jgi:UDP-2,3-diacylglucosamine pyrophosphatase LpxH